MSATAANAGYETRLSQMVEAEYSHVVLGLLFLKYISDALRCPQLIDGTFLFTEPGARATLSARA